MEQNSHTKNWCTLPSDLNPDLVKQVEDSARLRMLQQKITAQDVLNIQNRQLDLIPKDLEITDERLEKLRRLCQLWEVDIRDGQIKSHRKVIGPVIVAVKKLMFPVLKFMLKDLIREQKDFNAATIRLLADLCNKKS